MHYECWDGWNVVLAVCDWYPRDGAMVYYQFPIEPRFQ